MGVWTFKKRDLFKFHFVFRRGFLCCAIEIVNVKGVLEDPRVEQSHWKKKSTQFSKILICLFHQQDSTPNLFCRSDIQFRIFKFIHFLDSKLEKISKKKGGSFPLV